MVIIQGCNSLGFKVNIFIIWSGGIVSKFLSITIENGNSFIAFFVITNDDFNRDSLQEAIENGAVVAIRPFTGKSSMSVLAVMEPMSTCVYTYINHHEEFAEKSSMVIIEPMSTCVLPGNSSEVCELEISTVIPRLQVA